MTDDTREFDIIIFGGTGFTGQYVIEELANSIKNTDIKWCVAGRNEEKVRKSLEHVQKYLDGIDILDTPIIRADTNDQNSILEMCKQTKVILNCVGPYNLYGDSVVSACIEAGTHHVDISAEFSYLELTQANYFQAAKKRGVYVVQACGFGSLPGDYGITLLKSYFTGDLNSVEYYVELKEGPLGRKTNIGTFLSGIGSLWDYFNLSAYSKILKKEVFVKDLVNSPYKLRWRFKGPVTMKLSFIGCHPYFSYVVRGWCVWYIGPDETVIRRSQKFQYSLLNERPVQSHGYAKVSLLGVFYILFFGVLCLLLSLLSFGRTLLAKNPELFTSGQFSKDGPTRQQAEQCSTEITFIGEGWKYKLSEPTDQHGDDPDTKIKLTVTGPEAAYPLTSMCMVQAGLTVLQEKDKMPLGGGVMTPGVAFEHTTLQRRLEKRGMKFTFENM